MIRFNCPKCGHVLAVDDPLDGHLITCPACSNTMVAPKSDSPAMSPATISPLPRPDKDYTGQARAALILGIASIVLPVIGWATLILAIIFGILAINRNKARRALPLAGIAMAGVAIVCQLGWPSLLQNVVHLGGHGIACGANLIAIGKAVGTYAADNGGSWPIIRNDAGIQADAPMDAGGSDDLWKLGSAKGLNAIENLNLLLPDGYIQYKTFICPASGNTEMERGPKNGKYGFKDRDGKIHCDYAYQICYTNCRVGDAKPADNATDLTKEPDSALVILADRPDPSSLGNLTRAMNHKTDGVNMLAGYSVSWSNGRTTCGWGNNNIYLRDIDGDSTPPDKIVTPGKLDVPNSK